MLYLPVCTVPWLLSPSFVEIAVSWYRVPGCSPVILQMVVLLVSPSASQWAASGQECGLLNRLKLQDRPVEVTFTTAESELELITFKSAVHRGPSDVWTWIRRSQKVCKGHMGLI